jgi:hypothetical protein
MCATTTWASAVDLDVADSEVLSFKSLGLGVGLSVLQQTQQRTDWLLRPSTLGDTLEVSTGLRTADKERERESGRDKHEHQATAL